VNECFRRIARVLNDFHASLIIMDVEHMVAGDGSILIFRRMPGHCDAVGRHIQYGEILGFAWHCKEK